MKENLSENAVSQIAEAVMRGVALLIQRSGKTVADYKQATDVIKAEIKAFLFGDEYLDERIVLLRRSLHQDVVVSSVCLGAFSKIQFL